MNVKESILVPAILSQVKLRWIVYGVAAYYGLKLLSKKGLLPQQADAALDVVDQGIDLAKEKIGFKAKETVAAAASHIH
jgi:hypothetical protein